MRPTERQYEAFILRCGGLKWWEVAERMMLRAPNNAAKLGIKAARTLLEAPPSPAIASDRALALYNFPKIAAAIAKERKKEEA